MSLQTAARFVLTACVIVLSHSFAEAQDDADREEAQGLFMAGRAAYDAGRYDEALERFEGAYALSGRSELLYNVGLAADRARQDRRALEAYESYLEAEPDSEYRESIEGRVAAIRRAIAEREAVEAVAAASEQEQGTDASQGAETREATASPARSWWLWTLIGVVVVGAAVTTAVLVTRDSQQAPDPGDYGVVLQGLRW